ncbi:hypothetical protein H0R92_08610 [Treponema sp. OMZ 840]|uniref:hypothetical protein n=1 Tax=Treponema sp. OMZ 840 TaxID=244313 RepID=UPI003D8F3BB9
MLQSKRTELYIKISALTVFAVLIFFVLIDLYRFRVCFKAAKNIPPFSQTVLMRFSLYGSGSDTVSAVFYLYNSENKELAAVERSWKGASLAIDFVGARFSGKTVYFPRFIYGYFSELFPVRSSRKGTRLSRYYMQNKNCLLYDFKGYEKDFFRLARYALRLDMFGLSQRISGALYNTHRTLSLAACEPGKTYIIKTDSNGGLEVLAE